MGYSKADKAQSHERIVRTAAMRFREKGIDGISVADLMKEAGLTHGGFYRHFESREDLVAQAVACALAAGEGNFARELGGEAGIDLASYVELYLSEYHCANPGDGCAMSALAGDMARAGPAARALYANHVRKMADYLSSKMSPDVPETERRANALYIVSTLVGALSVARATGDTELASEILTVARERLVHDFARSETRPEKR
jgi:TetR/AcrR family transcriptional repressor of nem operon